MDDKIVWLQESVEILTDANERLRQQVDDLMAFAKEYVEAWDSGMAGDSSLYNSAKAAIDKATGGE